ncbi:MAG: bifunctional serine/threonine-protein kinase/formylglycine-generating enzyme family protein [Deltaproteobacteria bacterium]|nr:bifunctional serine/threonine-protein kinase/formylglycine-generating enzyme family protein [Deltaproteobacteria bacterium]
MKPRDPRPAPVELETIVPDDLDEPSPRANVAPVAERAESWSALGPSEDDSQDDHGLHHARPRAALVLPARYQDLGPVAEGGFGEVRRVRDTLLDRVLVLKLLRPDIAKTPSIRRRFFAEVRVTASLQHPGVVPIYDYGELVDGRLWYAMKEVRGSTFGALIAELHAASGPAGYGQTASGWTFRRVIEAFARVAQTVAFAHARAVIHRDLKPDNLMVGEFGEVLVMDWGLALRLHARDEALESRDRPALASDAVLTRAGDVLGTPAYMPREQALGDRAQHGPHSDVYSLGAILFHTLTGRPPFRGSAREVLSKLLLDDPPSIDEAIRSESRSDAPEELRAACARAMRVDPSDRGTAESLASAVVAWLDGANKREQALLALAKAAAREPEIKRLRVVTQEASDAARARWSSLRPFDSVEDKRPAWGLEDQAQRAARDAALEEARWLESLHGVLTIDPSLPEAHDALATHYRAALIDAERAHQIEDAARFETMLRAHDRGQNAAFLRGEGALTIVTDPPGATISCARFVLHDRRLVEQDMGVLGTSPLVDARLPFGSYVLTLAALGRATVRYPIEITRDGRWITAPDASEAPYPIALPLAEAVHDDEAWIAEGWTWLGGDPNAPDSLPRQRVWIDAFALRKDPITVKEYLAFCNNLAREGRVDEALAHRPMASVQAVSSGADSPFVLQSDGQFVVVGDGAWGPDVPVVAVTWRSAMAFARWCEARDGQPWRLADEFEREKAARGADGRLWPWGNHGDASFACVLEGHRGEPKRASVGAHVFDVSVYGVRGLAGNVADWCANVWRHEGSTTVHGRLRREIPADDSEDFRAARGGAWSQPLNASRASARLGARPHLGRVVLGLRLAR